MNILVSFQNFSDSFKSENSLNLLFLVMLCGQAQQHHGSF
jgi:hypothetical protein